MNLNLISLFGGGIAAAATLVVGIVTSRFFGAIPADAPAMQSAGETIYVEQPVVQVAPPAFADGDVEVDDDGDDD